MSSELTVTTEYPAPMPVRAVEGVDVRVSAEDWLLARVALAAVAGFAVAVSALLALGIAVIS